MAAARLVTPSDVAIAVTYSGNQAEVRERCKAQENEKRSAFVLQVLKRV